MYNIYTGNVFVNSRLSGVPDLCLTFNNPEGYICSNIINII